MKIITFTQDYLDKLDKINSALIIDVYEDYDPVTQIMLYHSSEKCIKTVRTDGSKYYAIRCCNDDDVEIMIIKERTGSFPEDRYPQPQFICINTYSEAVEVFENLTPTEAKSMHVFYIIPQDSDSE